jgi:DNA ligase D-like protein (predicted polymerase)
VIDTTTGITKLDVVNHYLAVAKLILPHLVKRPVSLVRAPAGIAGQLFFQKHADTVKIPDLRELDPAISPDHKPMVEIDSFTALIGAAQANVIELHTWNATTKDTTRPDRLVFDLDPGEGVTWKQIQEGTELTRALLEELGLVSFLKTSGGKGLHVIVPLTPKDDWDAAKAVAKAIVEHMATVIPDRFVAKSGAKNRVGRIFVDYLRNGFGATTACAWSARGPARPRRLGAVRVGRARRAQRRRALDDPQRARADRGARRSLARLRQDAPDAGAGEEDAARRLAGRRARSRRRQSLATTCLAAAVADSEAVLSLRQVWICAAWVPFTNRTVATWVPEKVFSSMTASSPMLASGFGFSLAGRAWSCRGIASPRPTCGRCAR